MKKVNIYEFLDIIFSIILFSLFYATILFSVPLILKGEPSIPDWVGTAFKSFMFVVLFISLVLQPIKNLEKKSLFAKRKQLLNQNIEIKA